jgi:hypothetical protein
MLYELQKPDGTTIKVVADQITAIEVRGNNEGITVHMENGKWWPVRKEQKESIEKIMALCHPTASRCIMAAEPLYPTTAYRDAIMDAAKAQQMSQQAAGQPGGLSKWPIPEVPTVQRQEPQESSTTQQQPQQRHTGPGKGKTEEKGS